jgi:hypothetical protein
MGARKRERVETTKRSGPRVFLVVLCMCIILAVVAVVLWYLGIIGTQNDGVQKAGAAGKQTAGAARTEGATATGVASATGEFTTVVLLATVVAFCLFAVIYVLVVWFSIVNNLRLRAAPAGPGVVFKTKTDNVTLKGQPVVGDVPLNAPIANKVPHEVQPVVADVPLNSPIVGATM